MFPGLPSILTCAGPSGRLFTVPQNLNIFGLHSLLGCGQELVGATQLTHLELVCADNLTDAAFVQLSGLTNLRDAAAQLWHACH